MEYIIGVDGGGTKTESVAYDLNGKVLYTSLTGFGNVLNNKEEALNNIKTGIKNIFEKLGKENVKGIYLGLAGSEVGDNTKVIHDAIKDEFEIENVVMNDGELALKATLKGEDGILTIAGTGSIAFGIKEDRQAKAGGWGHLLGDEGSAYKIAIEALKNMIHENDFSLPLSDLSKALLKELNVKEVDDIVAFVYSKTKDEVASITKVVSSFAENGNEIALKIMQKEGLELAKTTENVYKKLNFDKCSIGLVGGVIKKSKVVRETFETYLKEHINVVEFVDEDVSPAKGAYYIYKKTVVK
ncbi:BadF-type ATPase [Clostridium cavendishii DSM 21758]|uniref:BadF-type ATPase n=1 Tax=Clostridium cavendishii DSM 21758 TaxID=1121302 RepID=A0A1M6U8J4_9CLOT|nr:BadF/BadG/BcrA/BcrD ATPase family protein [Clostridium cavendishii]SHK65575.1 BadF-type ATPase [Clostridium cavendishii DSM 21758]